VVGAAVLLQSGAQAKPGHVLSPAESFTVVLTT
jgi:hypothetical protein